MGFSKTTAALAIPREETRRYFFDALPPSKSGERPSLTITHFGDGSPAFATVGWHTAAKHSGRTAISKTVAIERAMATADLVAKYCVRAIHDVFHDDGTPATVADAAAWLTSIIVADEGLEIFGAFNRFGSTAANFRDVSTVDPVEVGKP